MFKTFTERLSLEQLEQQLMDNLGQVEELIGYSVDPKKKAEEVVSTLMTNADHGIRHSQAVYERACEIICRCPKLQLACYHQEELDEEMLEEAAYWSALLHDIGYFFGLKFREHEKFGAKLAGIILYRNTHIASAVFESIFSHDYFSPVIDGDIFPDIFILSPAAEIFRLADKTSLSPEKEIERYYDCGKGYEGVFFNAEISDDERFDFSGNYVFPDRISAFIFLFALQPEDFFFGETRDLYRQWAKGKNEAMLKIIELAAAEGCPPETVRRIIDVIKRFHQRFELPMVTGW